MIKRDEEFLRQLEFKINQLMISSWPMNIKVIGGEIELKDLEHRNPKGRKDFADILAQHDSRDSVFNKGGSSDDWMGDYMTGEKPRP